MANKLLKPKRGRVENLPKLAVEDGSLIFAYDTKSPTSTVLVDVGETRYELSAAIAKKADDSNALGGSSLQNIVDKINNATGDGTAFTGLDTTENNKVKLTRANGGTVEKTINNVSNASTADYAKTAAAGTADYLYRNPASRSTSANLAVTGLGGLRTFKATGNMTEGKPPVGDAHIIHLDWDNIGGFDAQIAVQNSSGQMAVRGMSNKIWQDWRTVLDSVNYTDYAAKKNAYNSASISNATITFGRSDGSTGTTLTVDNVSHASTANLAKDSNALGGSSLSQVLASAGGGNAFTGLDTTINNKVKLTRANGGTVEKTINNVSNASSASFASTATLAAYPQGFESRMTSATWGNTTGTFLTGWHTSSGGDVAFMNDNPSNGKLSMKLDGYFYQNEGANRVLDTSDAANYVKKTGDTMTGLLTLKTGSQQGIKLGSAYISNHDATNGEIVLQGGHLRFGASDWDYDKWAGLKYDADNKYVYLGIADGTVFTADNPQSGGLLFTPGISGIYIGGTTTTRVVTSSDLSSYVAKSGDTMTGTLQVNAPIFGYRYSSNNDSPAFVFDKPGDHYTGIGAHGTDTIYFSAVNTSGLTWNHDYKQKWIFNGSVSATTVTADCFDGTIANATSAENASHLGGKVASDYALKADLSGDINALSAKRLPSYQSVSVANSFFYRYGVVGNTSDGGAWTGFPSATLYNAASTVNGFGNALFQKKVGVLHLASGSSAHDLVFQAGGTNGGIAYVATGRDPAYILDTLNYKDKAYTFNKLTASSTFTATSGVVIDGGSY